MENYEFISHIGKGSFGHVSKIRRKSDGKILVWKEMDYGKMTEKEKLQLVSEVNILRDLKHPNIVRYYDRVIDKKNARIYIIMEYCEGGDMRTFIQKCKKDNQYLAEDVIWKMFTQLILALNDCHNHKIGKILHRDLKPANIFFDNENNVKLGDFGLSKMMESQSVLAQTHVGTPYYMSPEQIGEQGYNEKSDIWSAGCILYQLASLKPAFEAKNHLALAMKIKEGKFERIPIRYSGELQKLIEIMLNVNPERRPAADVLLRFPLLDMRVKEKKLREKFAKAKYLEDELEKKEKEMREREANLNARISQAELKLSGKSSENVSMQDLSGNLEAYKRAQEQGKRGSVRAASGMRGRRTGDVSMVEERRSCSKEYRNMSFTYQDINNSFNYKNYEIRKILS